MTTTKTRPKPRQQPLPLASRTSPDESRDSTLNPQPFVIATPIGRQPELADCEDLADAVRCVQLLDSRRQTIEAERDAELQRTREQAAQRLHVLVGGERLTFDEWRGNLIAAIETFVRARPRDVFPEDKKTAAFPSGQISAKSVPAAVRLADDVKADDVAGRMAQRHKLTEAVQALLEKTGLAGWLRVSVALDLAGIQRRFKDGQLKKKELPAGLVVTDPREDISVKPFPQPERADAAA